MKNLKDILEASVLGNIDNSINNMDSEAIKVAIQEFIDRTYFYRQRIVISDKPDKDGKYVLTTNSGIIVRDPKIESLTNGMFVWGTVSTFDCSYCQNLKSLEGSPKEVKGYFICNDCKNLTSLKGGPLTVDGDFSCRCCTKLKSLEFAPKRVGGIFYCGICGKDFSRTDVQSVTKVANINIR